MSESIHSDTNSKIEAVNDSKHWWSSGLRVNKDDAPPQIYNRTLYLSIFVFGILGCARGYDEGCISGTVAQTAFIKEFGLKDPSKTASQLANLKSNITSMVQLGSIGGSLVSIYAAEALGRIRTLQVGCLVWALAAIIQITSHSIGQLYAGRLIEGFCIGTTVVCGPCYISECAPKAIRGTCNNIFAGAVYFGIMMAYFANYGTALHQTGRNQWIYPTSIKIVLAGSILILSMFFCIESPRWLIKKGNMEQALINFSKLRHLEPDHPYILSEIADINEQLQVEREAIRGTSLWTNVKSLVTVKSIRIRMVLCFLIQILGQWSGANAITIYAPELFAMVGKSKQTDRMMMTALLGVVKFTSAYLSAFFLIDFIGRKKSLYAGITIQLISSLYFAIYMTIVPQAAEDDVELNPSQVRAGKGALASIYFNGIGWTMGWNSVQYLFNSEVLPLRVRSLGTAVVMAFHFANQYGNSKAVPSMLLALTNYGAFYFFAGVCLLGLVFGWFLLPEVTGRSLESMEELFALPWYLIGRRGAQLAPDHSEVNRIHFNPTGHGNAHAGDIDIVMKEQTENIEYADDKVADRELEEVK
ncbi:hypothetical protein KL918_004092 [Ogataea parapolymorpha]|uniref:MFS transporter, sugar porter (SP) family n=1 Tax=Ogataea parapolymorpha (strain ATCC 26012 / BCRC 20466 / JCM 22074 / NRRL Y-7560 / DL-1) TaxID=871575 RepID=W1QCA1_OGAPD|nr:MFS transporter, sugar porter (SP) family [Ogataea parapolymorpha DL-1]ESW98164.1 MFS transporter, sugar porter (SP) family [Ogataea parapolymorpha DL-1]KAG7866103.1 hypothetical protein KL918_004092 [Ogataea parapolymorpha]KAG7874743.1 hypothetical protein KL916_000987 [Ogataea parapolymorpha]